MKGRDPRDVGMFAQRICGVCTFHHYERGVEATESVYGVTIPPNARSLRNLIWAAQTVNDHSTHFYQLHSMDWWDVVSALSADPERATERRTVPRDPYNASVSHYRASRQAPHRVRAERPARPLRRRLLGPPGTSSRPSRT
jgi:quinone-reactive Ni/Fe-hydrogenase large subunit